MKYKHGGNIYKIQREYDIKKEELIDFSANINPLGLPLKIKSIINENIAGLINYPDPDYPELKRAVATHEKIMTNKVFLGNGAIEMIYDVTAYINPKKALIVVPTFVEYEKALRKNNAQITYYQLSHNDFKIDISALIDRIKQEGVDAVYLCNPNNPTGQILKNDQLVELIQYCKKTTTALFVDEAFIDFIKEPTEYSVKKYIDYYEGLYILKSFTKFFAIPGLRLGYVLTSNEGYRDYKNSYSIPWHINFLAAKVGERLFSLESYINETYKYFEKEMSRFYNQLKEIKWLRVYQPSVNYIFFKLKIPMDLKEELLQYKILIRCCDNYINLTNDYYRVAIKSKKENDYLVKVLKKIGDQINGYDN